MTTAMSIDWSHFTPVSAVIGGLLVGVAAAALVLFNGRIAGISGIVGGLLHQKSGEVAWRAALLIRANCGSIRLPVVRRVASERHRRRMADSGVGRRPRWSRHKVRLWLHQRPRRVRPVAVVASFAGGNAGFHDCGHCDGLCEPSSFGVVK